MTPKNTLHASAAAFVVAAVLPVSAQVDQAAETTSRLDTVVITAAHRPQALIDIPASVISLDANELEIVSGLDSGEELASLLTGVQAATANGTQIAFQIRGIGAVDHQALTPGAAAVYSDGVFQATNVQTGLFLYDIAGVDVLKGPQGSVYGRNASSGAIHINSARPGPDQANYFEAGIGNFNRAELSAAWGGQSSENSWFRIAGRLLQRDAVLDNVASVDGIPVGPEEAGGVRDEFGLRASWLYQPTDGPSVLVRGHYEEDNGINATPLNDGLDLGDHEISTEGDGVQDTDNEFYGASLEFNASAGAWDVTTLSAVEGYNQQYGFDFDGSPAPFGVSTLNANLSYDRDFVQFSQDVRAQRDWSGVHTLIGATAGFDDFSQRYTIWCGQLDPATMLGTCRYVGGPGRAGPTPASPGTATTLITDIDQSRETFALYTLNDVDLTQNLTLTLGGRYTYENIEGSGQGIHIFDDGVIALNNRDGLGDAIGSNEITEDRLTGSAALRYGFANGGAAYASVSNGYKSGGFNGEVQNNATHFADEGLFSAETVTAYELGYKSAPSPDFSWTVAAFYQDYDAPQARIFVSFPLPDGSTITSNSLSNLDAATSAGFEANLDWTPMAGLDLTAGLTLLETEIDQTTDIGGNAATFDGNPLPFASDVSATLGARYEWQVSPSMRAALRANGKYRDDYFLDAEGLDARSQQGVTTMDAEASLYLDDRDLELSVWGRNLTDEDYAVSGYGFIGYNTFRSDPLTYGVRLRYRPQ